jgi:hypothetical protein
VLRYTHIESSDPNDVRFSRYENHATTGRGEYHGWTSTTCLRLSF